MPHSSNHRKHPSPPPTPPPAVPVLHIIPHTSNIIYILYHTYIIATMSLRPTLARTLLRPQHRVIVPAGSRGIGSTPPRRAGAGAGHEEHHGQQEDDSTHTHECMLPFLQAHYHFSHLIILSHTMIINRQASVLVAPTVRLGYPYSYSQANANPSFPIPTMAKHPYPNHSLCPNLPIPPFAPKVLCITISLTRQILININLIRRTVDHEAIGQIYTRVKSMDR